MQTQTQMKIQDLEGLSPSFSCYSSNSLTFKAITKVIHEEHKSSRFDEFQDVEGEDFEFSLGLRGEEEEEVSAKEIDLKAWKAFPVFDHDLPVDRENGSASVTSSLQKLFIDDHEESSSHSSSEADELENIRSGTFCLWSPKAEIGSSSPAITKCKKSSSTGSTGSKKWKIRCTFKRSNSEGKEPMVLLPPNNSNKKIDTAGPKQKRSSHKVSKVLAGRFVHEQFYLQRRAEKEMGKKKSYLPYRKDMFGLFANVNGRGKINASLLK